ncbi:CocE/NonD family hydrolase [Bacillus lacus]|uniref:Xaa-Pro dipeptidyl-peptidase n=1 Tax=Metabacillus lacus TaxID=1983721 RepID=A0A7X2J387_9BACI|nr:Xaa-Pro dipeptidyl-peptidase [Metabacillus lacus]MRX73813.1 CocE/NonD family hydrolase [Metabacillus lacus]
MKKSALRVLMSTAIVIPLLSGGGGGEFLAGQTAQAFPQISVKDGMTQPIFSFNDAIVERVFVETETDSDGDGKLDRVRADIMRPKETNNGLKVPVIYEMSPYRSGIKNVPVYDVDVELHSVAKKGKNKEGAGVPQANLSGYYDDYFVPRGYAVVLAESVGTGLSDGCPTTGDEHEILGTKAVIDWLNGRANAFDVNGNKVRADWSTGNVGMTGVSYNGTLPNAVAATGVEGLKTIVPVAAISSWYEYYRANGAVIAPGGYQGEDADNMAEAVLTRKNPEVCQKVIESLTKGQDRQTGDYNSFWDERNYTKDADKIEASVFVVHGLNDWNVKTKHFSDWWNALQQHHVPSKLWLHQGGHSSPYSFRRDVWLETLNKWFDHWLYDIQNDVMDQPAVDIQREDRTWHKEENWPAKGAADTKLYFKQETSKNGSFSLKPVPNNNKKQQHFVDDAAITAENLIKNPAADSENRLAYLTPPLKQAVRFSGTPQVTIRASLSKSTANLTALLVKYGSDGKEEIVTRGWSDPQNIKDENRSVSLTPNREYTFTWDMQPDDYVFAAGDRLVVVLISSDYHYTLRPKAGTKITIDPERSHLVLPVQGGKNAFQW